MGRRGWEKNRWDQQVPSHDVREANTRGQLLPTPFFMVRLVNLWFWNLCIKIRTMWEEKLDWWLCCLWEWGLRICASLKSYLADSSVACYGLKGHGWMTCELLYHTTSPQLTTILNLSGICCYSSQCVSWKQLPLSHQCWSHWRLWLLLSSFP